MILEVSETADSVCPSSLEITKLKELDKACYLTLAVLFGHYVIL